jgi:hypothetical protein
MNSDFYEFIKIRGGFKTFFVFASNNGYDEG